MRNKKLLLLFPISCLSLASCTRAGDVLNQPRDIFKVHGETFKAVRIVPCDNCSSIWVVYPKDPKSTSTVINTQYEADEDNTVNTSIINIE